MSFAVLRERKRASERARERWSQSAAGIIHRRSVINGGKEGGISEAVEGIVAAIF